MEEIYESQDEPSSKLPTQQHKRLISSENIDQSELNPDHAFEVLYSNTTINITYLF
jgi:hypothetical protein